MIHPSRCIAVILTLVLAAPAAASFHLMQIEQVIGGVCGDTSQQAIQLRMRTGGQNVVSGSRVNAFGAAGGGLVLLRDMTTNVGASAGGSRVLLATSAFAAAQGITPDFTLTSAIPVSYLPAGRVTFEDDVSNVYWSLAWGGAAYTGSTTGALDNDADGDFGPAFPEVLPSTTLRALRFEGAFGALSTNNAADYSLTLDAAVFTNNAGTSTTVTAACTVFEDGFETGDVAAWSSSVP